MPHTAPHHHKSDNSGHNASTLENEDMYGETGPFQTTDLKLEDSPVKDNHPEWYDDTDSWTDALEEDEHGNMYVSEEAFRSRHTLSHSSHVDSWYSSDNADTSVTEDYPTYFYTNGVKIA